MKILVLGASGFIGRNMKRYFERSYEIDAPSHRKLDILDEHAVKKYFAANSYDVVVNCLDEVNGDHYFENRLRMHLNLQKYSDWYGKMIYYGSGAEYDRFQDLRNVSENELDTVIPRDTYGFCLQQLNRYSQNSTNIYNLRLFGIYGEHELWAKRFISNAICKVLYGYPITIRQDRKMDYLYIEDLCRMTEWIINAIPQRHDYNAVTGQGVYLSEIAKMIVDIAKKDVPIYIAKEGNAFEYTGSNQALLEEIGDFDYIQMKTAIERMIVFYQEHWSEIDGEKLLYQS